MKYKDLIERVSEVTGHPEAVVREILLALPPILACMKVGDSVRTPFGVFRALIRKERRVRLPNTDQFTSVRPNYMVALKSGTRLQIDLTKKELPKAP